MNEDFDKDMLESIIRIQQERVDHILVKIKDFEAEDEKVEGSPGSN